MFSIDHPTLNRFYSFHYTLPFILAGLSIFHIAALHQYGSTNPLGINTQSSTIYFGTYFGLKDLVAFLFLVLVFAILVFFYPEYLGQLAVQTSNCFYYNSAICWERLLGIGAQIINLPKVYLAKIQNLVGNNSDQSAGNERNQNLMIWLMVKPLCHRDLKHLNSRSFSSSETTRDTPNFYSTKQLDSDDFYCWLGGLTDGDGSFFVSKEGYFSFELTLDAKDIQCLYKIKTFLKVGSVTKRSSVNAYRFRLSKSQEVFKLAIRLNEYLLTSSKRNQLNKVFNFAIQQPNKPQTLNFIRDSAWLTGFFDAEGHFLVMNKFTLTFNIAQKDKQILEFIQESLGFGHIRHDSSWNGWIFTVSTREGIRIILNYLSKYPCQTTKNADTITFKRLLYFMDQKYHYLGHPNRSKVESLIQTFKNRYKTKLGEDIVQNSV